MATIAKDNIIVEIITKGAEKAGRSIKSVGKDIGGLQTLLVRGTAALAAFFAVEELNRLAVQLDAVQRKAQIVFGNTLPTVNKAAKENATAMGLTTSEYVAAASAIQDLLVPMGFTRKEATAMSIDLTDLSGALSVWTNGKLSAKEVSDILNKAVLGEREGLKALGISIDENTLKNELKRQGLDKLTGASLKQARAAATLKLITEQTTDAQSSFIKNADSLVQKQSELRAQISQISESLAQRLVPAFGRLLDVANGFLDWINDYLATPWEEEMRQEQSELNLLVSRITDASNSQETRNKLINDLQREYPDFLGNLDAEKVTNEELASRLGEVNNQYIFKIALQREDNKIQEQVTKLAENRRVLAERELKVQEALLDINEKYKLGLDFTNLTLQDRIDLLRETFERDVRAETDVEALNNQRELQRVIAAGLEISKLKIESDETELSTLQKKREELRQNLLLQLGINEAELGDKKEDNDDKKGDDKDDDKKDDDKKRIDETEKLIDGSFAQLRQQISDLQEEITKAPPESAVFTPLIKQLNDAEEELRLLEGLLDRIKNSINNPQPVPDALPSLSTQSVTGKSTEEEIKERANAGLAAALELAKREKEIREREEEEEKARAEKIKEIRKDLAQSLKTLALDVLQFQIEQKDAEIAAQQQRVSKFQSLAEKGTAEQLELEEARLAKLTEEREKFVQRQRALSALEIATSTAVSIAKFVESIAKASADAPIIGTVLQGVAIAATVVSTILAVKNALSNIPAFRTGIEDTSTVRGGSNENGFLSILHPSERVLTKEQNAPLLRAGIKNEDIPMLAILGKQRMQSPRIKHDLIYKQLTRGEGSNNEALLSEMKGIRKRLDKMEMSFSVTEKGIHAAFMKYQNRESKRKAAIS